MNASSKGNDVKTRKRKNMKWNYKSKDRTVIPAARETLKEKIQVKAEGIIRSEKRSKFYRHNIIF